MTITPISPKFQGEYSSKIASGIKQTIADPTDVHNKDAVVSGTVAAGGVGGAAVVANRFNTMKNMAVNSRKYINTAVKTTSNIGKLKAKNVSILTDLVTNISKFLKSSKATSWISRAMNTPMGKKIIGGTIGLSALGITAAQLYSAGDMAFEAVKSNKDY